MIYINDNIYPIHIVHMEFKIRGGVWCRQNGGHLDGLQHALINFFAIIYLSNFMVILHTCSLLQTYIGSQCLVLRMKCA